MLSLPDMAILGVLALLVFGEQRLPKIVRHAGRMVREVQNTSASFLREMERAADVDGPASAQPAYTTPAGAEDEKPIDSAGEQPAEKARY